MTYQMAIPLGLPVEVDFVEGTAASVSEIFRYESFSHIFHLGEYARVEQSFDDVDKVFESNFGPLYWQIRYAASSGAKFIYSGSSTKIL